MATTRPNQNRVSTPASRAKRAATKAAKAALDANAASVTDEKLTQPDAGLTTSDEQSAAEAADDLGLAGTDPLPGTQAGPDAADRELALRAAVAEVTPVAPALAERRKRSAEAKAKRDAEKAAVAARAEQVAAEQAAAPAPQRGATAEQTAARDAKKTADAERVAKVIEMRKAGKKLGEIATELGYTSQQVVSGVLRRHAPELQAPRDAGAGGLTLTPEQVTELQAVEAKFGAKLTTLARALARATA